MLTFVVLVLVVVPLLRWLPERLDQDAVIPSDSVSQLMDAKMKYATFVAWWDGQAFGAQFSGMDFGVEGVEVSTTYPPFTCAVAAPASGQPTGTQAAWVLGMRSLFGDASSAEVPSVTSVLALWTSGRTNCDEPVGGEKFVDAAGSSLTGAPVAFAQSFSDPSLPALDVEGVYQSIPQDEITKHGREVFSSYEEKLAAVNFGTTDAQTDRALTALAEWVSVGVPRYGINPGSPQVGPVVLDLGTDGSTLQLPEGFSARWSGTTFCVDGSVAGAPVQHVDNTTYEASTPQVADGPCP